MFLVNPCHDFVLLMKRIGSINMFVYMLSQVGFEHMLPAATGRLTPFHGLSSPPIALDAYLERISKFGKCSPACFIMALAYLDRLEAVSFYSIIRALILTGMWSTFGMFHRCLFELYVEDRLCVSDVLNVHGQADPGMLIVGLNVHRLVITGVVLATKLTDDHYFNNAFYAKVRFVQSSSTQRLSSSWICNSIFCFLLLLRIGW